jgi:hypothetical protein
MKSSLVSCLVITPQGKINPISQRIILITFQHCSLPLYTAMDDPSTTVLSELFRKRLEVLDARLEILKKIRAPLEAPPPPRVPPAGLLRLPFEIRLQIFRYCIPRKHLIEVSSPRFYIGWPYEEVDHTLNLRDARDFEDDPDPELEDDAVYLEEYTLDLEDHTVYLEDDTLDLEDNTLNFEGDYWSRHKNKNSIFLVSKQISEEALDILYGENIFKLHLHGLDEVHLKKNFTEANRRRMRYLLLVARPMGVSYGPGKIPDNVLWSSILPQLKGLRIVAEQPVQARTYYKAPTLEQEMDRWVKWIKPFLQCFGQYLSRENIVQVDINGEAETRELVKECLPHGYREIRCRHVGDIIFKRGRFSWESGYWDDDDPINSRDADGDWGSD